MNTTKKMMALLLAAVMICSVFAGCGAKTEAPAATQGNSAAPAATQENKAPAAEKHVEFTFCPVDSGETGRGAIIDPEIDCSYQASVYLGVIENLLYFNDAGNLCPHLATDFTAVDELTWEFTIRDGVKFTNGKALDAEAVKKSLELSFEKNPRISNLVGATTLSADGQKLTIATEAACPLMPNYLTDPETAIFDVDCFTGKTADCVGTGAYIYESVQDDGAAELVRNEDYWQGKPIAERIHAVATINTEAGTMALQAGEIDWYKDISTTDLPLFQNDPHYNVIDINKGRAYFLYVNPDYGFTADPALREALTYAFDREAIVQGIYGGFATTTTTMFPSNSVFYDAKLEQPQYNLDTAKQMLADAGYVDTDGDGFIEKDGSKVTLNISCYEKNQFKQLSEAIQIMLKAVGIDSEIVVAEKIGTVLSSGNYNIGTMGYNTLTYRDAYNYLDAVCSSTGSSGYTIRDEEVDNWLAEMKASSDANTRVDLAKKIQQKVYATDTLIYLLHIQNNIVTKAEIQNMNTMFSTNQGNTMTLWTFDRS